MTHNSREPRFICQRIQWFDRVPLILSISSGTPYLTHLQG